MKRRNTRGLPCRFRTRRATSLLEVTVAVSLGMTMLGLSVFTMHLLMNSQKQLETTQWQTRSLLKLSSLYRRDAHAAVAVKLKSGNSAEANQLILQQPDERQVTYENHGGCIDRFVQEGNTMRHRDSFVLPGTSVATFELDGESKVATITIRDQSQRGHQAGANSAGTIQPSVARIVRIDAIVARDGRFGSQE